MTLNKIVQQSQRLTEDEFAEGIGEQFVAKTTASGEPEFGY